MLSDAVTVFGNKNWVAVAVLVPGRKNTQCRYRWAKYLDPDRSTNKFSGGLTLRKAF
jgi:hypothetical protein